MTEAIEATEESTAASESTAGAVAGGGGDTETAVATSSSYELLKKRLQVQGDSLLQKVTALNQQRLEQFGKRGQELLLRTRARTVNNCVARDMVRIGSGHLLFGYNVFIGLRQETRISDVFALYTLQQTAAGADAADELTQLSLEDSQEAGFLRDARFVADFEELYTYYKHATLQKLSTTQDYLLAAFQVGQREQDIRVFRWQIKPDGALHYLDNRGERDMVAPPSHDFDWQAVTREQHSGGKYPHINILDTVFVETTRGDLTIKIEDNTETGLGIYSEPVEDRNQALGDAEIAWAELGLLILLRVRPYREEQTRYFVFNRRTQQVERIDNIAASCFQLPDDHGIIFPGGCYLQSGEIKRFDLPPEVGASLRFTQVLRSSNGEDIAYVFYGTVPLEGSRTQQGSAPDNAGCYALFTYNLIDKKLATPILADGYALFADGRLLVFQSTHGEATRVHPMQLWQTPFVSEDFESAEPAQASGFFARIGNADLVRGISDLLDIGKSVQEQVPTRTAYENLIRQCQRVRDAYFWLDAEETGAVIADVQSIEASAQTTLAEFEKVESIRRETARQLDSADSQQRELLSETGAVIWREPGDFVRVLELLRQRQGSLHLLRGLRYTDVPRIDAWEEQLVQEQLRVGEKALQFLSQDDAFATQKKHLQRVAQELSVAQTATAVNALLDELDALASGLDLLGEQLGSLPGDDAVQRTAILDAIGLLYADLNRLRADARKRRSGLGMTEMRAEFSSQSRLFAQAVENALELADTPRKCDDTLTRLLAQLEDIEARFAEHEDFIADIAEQREAMYEALTARRQHLLDVQQQRAKVIGDAATRILNGIARRVQAMEEIERVHAYFAADPMLLKLRQQIEELRELGAVVMADDLSTRLKAEQEQALRTVRDRRELSAGDAGDIQLGRHRFTVNRQALDLTMITQGDLLAWQITGTDYLLPVADSQAHAQLYALRPYWQLRYASESPDVARAEYLCAAWLDAVQAGEEELTWDALQTLWTQASADEETAAPEAVRQSLRRFAASRYQEGYQRGIHDDDAAQLAWAIAPRQAELGLLLYGATERALALLYWHTLTRQAQNTLFRRSQHVCNIVRLFQQPHAQQQLADELLPALRQFVQTCPGMLQQWLPDSQQMAAQMAVSAKGAAESATATLLPDAAHTLCSQAAAYLVRELGSQAAVPEATVSGEGAVQWVVSADGERLAQALQRTLEQRGMGIAHAARGQQTSAAAQTEQTEHAVLEQWLTMRQWLLAYIQHEVADAAEQEKLSALIDDAATVLSVPVSRRRREGELSIAITGLRSEHSRIRDGSCRVQMNDFWRRIHHHRTHAVAGFQQLKQLRHELLVQEKQRLHLEQFQAQPLSTFVRNRLIDEAYLPLIGANLARQIGAAGEAGRSDRSGMLLLISPPGYGKTTLMEYVANRLGLVFVRVNGPALGHDVTSADPAAASNSAARQELEKLNLALAMGSNVMLYVDDIQHVHPEFLQKFISLADGTRRMEGVWQGKARTWDLRGKRFAVVMAGNPYTESGEMFRIPDMLANRADVYNLGDILSGTEKAFAMSYLENCLTAHPITQPLATREPADVQRIIRMAQGDAVDASELSHSYSTTELDEIIRLLRNWFVIRDVLLKVNQAYIQSAAQDDRYRSAPPFKLQGSYRNMVRLAPQVTPLMEADEIDALLRDHYRGEAQTLTSGAEENLLQLAHLIGQPSQEEQTRWQAICADYQKQRRLGGAEDDPSVRVTRGLLDISGNLERLQESLPAQQLSDNMQQLVQRVSTPLAAIAQYIQQGAETEEQHTSADTEAVLGIMRAQQQQTGQALVQTQQNIDQLLQGMTQNTGNSDRAAHERGMVDALLSLSVTYRKLILPLVRGIEMRMGVDANIRKEIDRLEEQMNRLTQQNITARGAGKSTGSAGSGKKRQPRRKATVPAVPTAPAPAPAQNEGKEKRR